MGPMTPRGRTWIFVLLLAVAAGYFADAHLPGLLADDLPEADSVLVRKTDRTLYLVRDGRPYREYPVAFGANPIGHKEREGDERTPEGDYVLDWRNPESAFHLSLHVSYPNARDRARAAAHGEDPGGMIMIHGQRNGLGWLGNLAQRWNWTDGCVAVSNVAMEEIWRAVPNGTPITLEP